MPPRDPDDTLVALFKNHAVINEARTLKEGRPIYDDIEVVEIRIPGARDFKVFPATAMSHWATDPRTGAQVMVTYAERFAHQFKQFRAQDAQTKSGTPLDFVPFLSEGKRAEMRAQNIYTVEALAAIDGAELKNLGPGGRELKNAAMSYMADAKTGAPNRQMEAELEALKARNAILEEDLLAKKERQSRAESEFEEMTLDQLRDYIETHTGQAPLGSMNKKTLIRMAVDCRPSKAA